MKELKEKIEQLKLLLQEIEALMQPNLDEQRRKEKQSQLRTVERSIVELQKSGTPVPDELRELKFRLVHESDLYKEYKTVQRELSNLLTPLVIQPQRSKTIPAPAPARKQSGPQPATKQFEPSPEHLKPEPVFDLKVQERKSGKKESYRISISDLVKSGLIQPGTELRNKYKGRWFKAVITEDGIIELEINGQLQRHKSPSGAAMAASGKSQDGWTWWSLTGTHHAETLDHYRKKYLHEANDFSN